MAGAGQEGRVAARGAHHPSTNREADLDAAYAAHAKIANRGAFFPLGVMSEPAFRKMFADDGFWEREQGTLLIATQDDEIAGHIEFFKPIVYRDAFELSYQLYERVFAPPDGPATVARTPLVGGRRSGQAGVSRPAVLIAGAVIAAVLVLAAGALRSGPNPAASASAASTAGPGSHGRASLPATATATPTVEGTAGPPEPTPVPSLRGEYVGGLAFDGTCMLLAVRGEIYELVLPDGFGLRERNGRATIIDSDRTVVAAEGDLVGLNGDVVVGGSFCMLGPRLHVSKIVDVVPRDAE